MSATAAINVNVPTDLNAKLEAQAKAQLTSKSAIVRAVLLRHVNEQEHAQGVEFARRRTRRAKQ